MNLTCPHCSKVFELMPEVHASLQGPPHFSCPLCQGLMVVPPLHSAPAQTGLRRPSRAAGLAALQIQRGQQKNLVVLGVFTLLVLGGIGFFLALRNGGSITNIFQNTTNLITHNSYFTQLIANGVTTEKDLEAIGEIRPYGDSFIGVSREPLDWEQAQALARRTGSEVLAIEDSAAGTRQQLTAWLNTKFASYLASTLWVRRDGQIKVLDKHDVLDVTSLKSLRNAVLEWRPSDGSGTDAPALATKAKPFINTLGMKFVPVPTGEGLANGQRVLFSVWETRVRDFEMFVKESGHQWSYKAEVDRGLDHAVAGVSWDDAQAFCTWLTQRERKTGFINQLGAYRLPTDYEWSCAVGIGEVEDESKSPSQRCNMGYSRPALYPWGSQWPPSSNSGNYWSEELRPLLAAGKFSYVGGQLPGYLDGQATVGPVGSYAPNQFGIFDLGGNVTEWCIDWFSAENQFRVLRGGSWQLSERIGLLSSQRYPSSSNTREASIGFRCVFDLAAQNKRSTVVLAPSSLSPSLSDVIAAVSKLAPNTDKAAVEPMSNGKFRVDVSGLQVTDFTPLHGMNVGNLQANKLLISDLSSVVGVGMEILWLMECPNLTDLRPLANCRTLRNLNLSGSAIADLEPLRGLPLSYIAISRTPVKDLSPLKGMPLKSFFFDGADADFDVSALSECNELEQVTIPKSSKNINSLRLLKNLKYISHKYDFSAKPQRPAQTASEFWADYDQAKMDPQTTPKELAELARRFDELLDAKVTSVYKKNLDSLNKNYSGSLARAIAAEKAARRFNEILLLEYDKKLADAGSKIPAVGGSRTGKVLATLRSVYHKSLASLEADRQKNLKALLDPLTKRLEQLEADFTNEKRMAEARQVKEYRLSLPRD